MVLILHVSFVSVKCAVWCEMKGYSIHVCFSFLIKMWINYMFILFIYCFRTLENFLVWVGLLLIDGFWYAMMSELC